MFHIHFFFVQMLSNKIATEKKIKSSICKKAAYKLMLMYTLCESWRLFYLPKLGPFTLSWSCGFFLCPATQGGGTDISKGSWYWLDRVVAPPLVPDCSCSGWTRIICSWTHWEANIWLTLLSYLNLSRWDRQVFSFFLPFPIITFFSFPAATTNKRVHWYNMDGL